MEKLYVILVLALALNLALGMNLRQRRQLNDNDEDLEDKYGFIPDRPNSNQFPGQNRPTRPGQGRPVRPGQGQFPGQGQLPGQGQQLPGQGQQQPTTQATPATTSRAIQDCIRNCPVTPEYNPVCGSDNVTYTNPGRLICAQNCGTPITLLRSAPCPTVASVLSG